MFNWLRPIQSPGGVPFTVSREHAEQFAGLLDDLQMAGYPAKQGQSGGFNPRNIAGTDRPSQHAFGRAIDVNWSENPRGAQGAIDPTLARNLATKHGMTWGGDWSNPDPMHFEVSGRAPVLPGLELLKADGSNARPGTQPMRDYQWSDVLPGEMMPAPRTQVAGYAAETPPLRTILQQDEPQKPSLLQEIVARASNPLFQQGLGLFLAASQGKDLNQGLSAGQERAQAMQSVMMKNLALQQEMQQRKAVQALLSDANKMAGVPPALIDIARTTGDPSAIVQYIAKQAAGGQTDDIKEYEYAKARGFQGSLQDWMVNKRASQGEYAKQLVYGTDDQGNIVPMQAGSRGDLVASRMPSGVKLQRDPIKLDLGDKWGFMDPTTRQIVGYAAKGLAEAERQKSVGEATGKAQADLPVAESNAKSIVGYINSVLNDPALDRMVGYQGYLPNVTPEARTLQAKIDQLKGQAFLAAFQSLKGGGAITEVEGQKATAALTRLQEMIQSGQDYRQALKDYRTEVQRLLEIARTKAKGGGALPSQVSPAAEAPRRLKFNPETGALE